VSLVRTALAMNANHPLVTIDQTQKEKLLHEVFDEYGDNPLPEE
jgi:hypothetical protein